ncbi:MAG: ATP-dependent Clp protease proteolytic subunit [Desulfobacteraceae bacterium]|nr:ATP-dependent Clp protease proteolytic subunit [Desulfobacteraceae bacterium]
MKRIPAFRPTIVLFMLFFLVCSGWPEAGSASEKKETRKVFVIPVSGTVDPGMAAFIERAHQEASKQEGALVILEINTFGGRVDSALQIVDTMLKFPKDRTIAYVSPKAISAGALIALSCGELVMTPGSTIGDVAPIMQSSEGPKELGEKFQSPIRAKFRALAERNGYPVPLVEAMVTKEKEVFEVKTADGTTRYLDSQHFEDLSENEKQEIMSKKTVVKKGELLTMHDTEALEYDFSMMTSDSIHALLNKLDIGAYKLTRIEETWSEAMVRLIDSIAPILMMIGLAGLYIEIKSPGFGLPGAVGVFCLTLVFLSQYLVGLANYTEFFILVAGIVLMGVEVFVLPGFGIAGFAGMILIVIGMVLAMQNFVVPDPSFPWQKELLAENGVRVLGAYVVAMIGGLAFIRYVMPRIPSSREGPYLTSSLKNARAETRETRMVHPGDTGVALTYLRPSGKAEINDEMFDVITENQYLEKDTPIKVIDIRGNRIIVDRKEPE